MLWFEFEEVDAQAGLLTIYAYLVFINTHVYTIFFLNLQG